MFFSLLAYITFLGALVTAIGGALYYLDNWLDRDETVERVTVAKHRAS